MSDVEVAGEELALDPGGAVYWPAMKALLVADLHFEKGSSYARRGVFVPPYDTAATLNRLAALVARLEPELVIALGDSFHDPEGSARMPEPYRVALAALQAGREWYWIAGNHDPEPPDGVGGEALTELAIGGLTFRHEPRTGSAPGEFAGHLHPCARLRRRGRSVRRRCFATDGTRMVLPAFGALTGGLNVLDEAWAGVFEGRRFEAWMIGRERLYRIAGKRLLGD